MSSPKGMNYIHLYKTDVVSYLRWKTKGTITLPFIFVPRTVIHFLWASVTTEVFRTQLRKAADKAANPLLSAFTDGNPSYVSSICLPSFYSRIPMALLPQAEDKVKVWIKLIRLFWGITSQPQETHRKLFLARCIKNPAAKGITAALISQ